jgi:hypothetical protein
MEPEAMGQAALAILRCYRELAPPLARTHGLTYPADLERMMMDRLKQIAPDI